MSKLLEQINTAERKEIKLVDLAIRIGDGLHGTPQYDDEGDFYFINGNNLVNGYISIKKETKKVNESEYIKYKKELGDRTILLGINGTLGNLAKFRGEKCILGKSAAYINIKKDFSLDYVYYVLLDYKFQKYIENNANGAQKSFIRSIA
jgi:type I restriction enzyme S subunit